MNRLAPMLLILISMTAPAQALDPERRDVIVVNARVWDGFAYKETFTPSTQSQISLMADHDNALSFVQTQEYYWPLSRQVYVDFESQRDEIEGTLRVEKDSQLIVEVPLEPYSIVYPDGVLNGNGSLLWGADALGAFAAYQAEEKDFAKSVVRAQRANTLYERRLLESGAARQKGAPAEIISPPPSVPEPNLRLVTAPLRGYRVSLAPGVYRAALFADDGMRLAGTERVFRVIDIKGSDTVVADIVPEERWTRPLASNNLAAKVYARPGSVFYVTLSEASRFDEAEYLGVVTPQADAVAGRSLWIRRKPSEAATLQADWNDASAVALELQTLKVEQTQGSGFGYHVRTAKPGEQSDLTAFMVPVPQSPAVHRGTVAVGTDFQRDIVIVQSRNIVVATVLALLPLCGYLVGAVIRRSRRRSPSLP
ncbi:hypothetical protein [Cypionkella sp.]|uniref:hypothetical protein n=1 Tax=Cypionkella sp. TaxID=2811411 RepID=UPI002ABACE93|nr:hypothetical protein [Cypionkella sp.]MDZ4392609.1 hypothetical protein [Cypionkella sp.]